MLNREEFKQYFRQRHTNILHSDDIDAQFFVKVEPIYGIHWAQNSQLYWDWCDKYLTGKVLCHWSDSEKNEEWWGFTNKDDITWWSLKWA